MPKSRELYLYFSDNELTSSDIKKMKKLNDQIKKLGLKMIKISDILKKSDISSIVKELRKYNVKAIVIRVENPAWNDIVFKCITELNLRKLERSNTSKEPLTNLIHTLVVSSPLFTKPKKIHNKKKTQSHKHNKLLA
ncbi:MAG: hypothetical protein ACP5PA_02045 [Elusimicrobiales bacterium]